MKINFTQIFTDSWNFVRNQPRFLVQFSVLFAVETILFTYFLKQQIPTELLSKNLTQMDLSSIHIPSHLYFVVLLESFINLFLFAWVILAINQYSSRQFLSFSQICGRIFQRLLGLIGIIFLIGLPLVMSAVNVILAKVSHSSASFIALLSFVLGIVIFVRFCLAFPYYLLNNITIMQCFQDLWRQGFKRSGTLFLFCLINYMFFPIIMQFVLSLNPGNLLIGTLLQLIASAVYVFSIIFLYRFYSCFIQKGER